MKRRHRTPEQIIRKLREAERMLGEGKTIPEASKELGISEQTYHRWRNQYGGMKADDAKRLKELERENAQLKATGRRIGPRRRDASEVVSVGQCEPNTSSGSAASLPAAGDGGAIPTCCQAAPGRTRPSEPRSSALATGEGVEPQRGL